MDVREPLRAAGRRFLAQRRIEAVRVEGQQQEIVAAAEVAGQHPGELVRPAAVHEAFRRERAWRVVIRSATGLELCPHRHVQQRPLFSGGAHGDATSVSARLESAMSASAVMMLKVPKS